MFLGPYLSEPGTGLHIAGKSDTEWQALVGKTVDSGRRGGINIEETGSLNSWLGSIDR